MPITASLGALSYAKTSLGESFVNWYLKVNTSVTFNDITFDNEGAFYTTGILTAEDNTYVAKFNDYGSYPRNIVQYRYLNTGTAPQAATAIKYNSYSNNIALVGSVNSPYPVVFPNYLTRWGYVIAVPKTLGAPAGNIVTRDYSANLPPTSNTSSQRRTEDFAIDSSTGECYTIGTDNVSGGGNWTVYYRKLAGTGSQTNLAYSFISYTYSTRIDDSTSITLDSTGEPLACFTIADTSNTNRRIIIRKINKVPVLSGFNFILTTTWQRKLTDTSSLQSRMLRLDSSDNIYLIATDSSYGYVIKYNSSGTIQWQRKIANVVLNGMYTNTSGDTYVVGYNTTNDLFIAKYNSSGTIQWQTKMSGLSYVGMRIVENGSNVYIVGQAAGNAFATKLPSNGTIPGTGSYDLGGGVTITYSIATQTESLATLTDAAAADTVSTTGTTIATAGAASNPSTINDIAINL